MVADSSVPAEVRELGRVLSRIMVGDTKVDLSGLPDWLAEAVRKELGQCCVRACFGGKMGPLLPPPNAT